MKHPTNKARQYGSSLKYVRKNLKSFLKDKPADGYVTTAQLAKFANTNLQTVHNWKLRGILPPPSHSQTLRGNKNYYRVSKLKARFG